MKSFVLTTILMLSLVTTFLVITSASEKMCSPKIRVVNNSDKTLSYVSLFSMKFKDLRPKDTSDYHILRYDPLKHDPLMYCVWNGKNLGRYLTIPDKDLREATYVVDSIYDGILYVRLSTQTLNEKKNE